MVPLLDGLKSGGSGLLDGFEVMDLAGTWCGVPWAVGADGDPDVSEGFSGDEALRGPGRSERTFDVGISWSGVSDERGALNRPGLFG